MLDKDVLAFLNALTNMFHAKNIRAPLHKAYH